MNILSIETSADETAISIVSVTGDFPDASYEILGNALHSQVALHTQYGGIFPAMAKREHAKAIIPLLEKALEDAELLSSATPSDIDTENIYTILARESDVALALIEFLQKYERPEIDLIAVTSGPGLEPALWVGVNTAKALASAWNIPVVPVNHMEGHILASVFDSDIDDKLSEVAFPAIALLISGGHTELVHMKGWAQYKKIGETRDDAVGEAFDKVARLMGLPYPGGPEIGKLAAKARMKNLAPFKADMPRPMLHSGDLDFSFSGIKTAVRYAVEGKELSEEDTMALSRDFEDATAEVLIKKTAAAIDAHGADSLIIGGGVSANTYFRQQFTLQFGVTHPHLTVYFPMPGLSTDNSIMIALAGHAKIKSALTPQSANSLIRADGNKSL
jgi:N6-L-threonylcarbamoyladenine synthase